MFWGALRRRPRASPPLTRSLDIRTRRLTSGMDADLAVVPHDADPGRRFHRNLESMRVLPWDGDQQPAARLRVAEHHLVELVRPTPINLVAVGGVVAAAAVGENVVFGQGPDALHERHGIPLHLCPPLQAEPDARPPRIRT